MKRTLPKHFDYIKPSDKGAYVLEFHLDKRVRLTVGKLGSFDLKPGWYYYTGSARNGLRGRLSRHILGPRKLYWHIDYLTLIISPTRIWYVLSTDKIESSLAKILARNAVPAIKRFGCGDSPAATTHLFYSESRLHLKQELAKSGQTGEIRVSG